MSKAHHSIIIGEEKAIYGHPKKITIVFIEDDPAIRNLFKRFLEIDGDFEIIPASNAEEGLELARQYQPSGILLDLLLPGMDGAMAIEIIKSDSRLTNIPTIVLTSQRGANVDCDEFVVKPVTPHELRSRLQAFFAARYG